MGRSVPLQGTSTRSSSSSSSSSGHLKGSSRCKGDLQGTGSSEHLQERGSSSEEQWAPAHLDGEHAIEEVLARSET